VNKDEDQFKKDQPAPSLNDAINSYIKAVHDYAKTSNKALDDLGKHYGEE
jgi:hypothetical protein